MAEERNRPKDEHEESGRIKVTDRRHFTSDGEAREDPPAETPPAAPSAKATAAPPPPPAPEAAPRSIDFVAFVQSLYVSALMALGEVENPYTHQLETNLDIARQNIDILVMLQDKTRGNLAEEEAGFLEQALPQLQLLYVKKAG